MTDNFPLALVVGDTLTKREIFAAAALQGLLAGDTDRRDCAHYSRVSTAYVYADSMIEFSARVPDTRTESEPLLAKQRIF